jgi:putative ABC transport system permease protein
MNDIRLGLRLCLRHPVLTVAAILSLALGIGANTAIFTVLNGSVLRPLPFDEPGNLVVVWETRADTPRRAVAPANFLDWRGAASTSAAAAQSFSALAAFDDFPIALTGQGEAQRLRAVSTSGNFFSMLGVQAAIGRTLTEDDDRPGAARVVMLADGLWQRLFGGAANALGQSLILNDLPHTIVGVLPPAFAMPMTTDAEVWIGGDRGIPRSMPFPGDITAVRDSHMLMVIGRLAPGVTRQQAQAQLSGVMVELSARFPQSNAGLGVNVLPLHEEVVGNVRPLIVLLQVAVAVLLLIACANVAHLLMGQAAGRQAEMSLRVALGADRSRLVKQLLIETLLIAVPGGVAGLALAAAGVRALVALAPAGMPRVNEIELDPTVLAFTAGMTLLTSAIFGLGPALQTARTSATSLAQGGQRVAGQRGVKRGHQAVVITELALAQVLLVGAGLLLASFVQATQIDLGYATTDRVVAEANLSPDYVRTVDADGRIDPSRKIRFINSVLDSLRQAPGVRAVAASFTAPLTGAPNRGIRIEGDPAPRADDQPTADFQVVTADYFTTVGITLVSGRAFAPSDRANAPRVVVVNQALADKYLAGRDPVGRVLLFGGNARHEIVGVVGNARYRSVEQAADPTFYLPIEQNDERWPYLTVTTWGGTPAMVRDALRRADPLQPLSRVRTIEEVLDQALAPRRFNTWMVGLFALTALVLASVGIYGVMSFAVAARTRELGVRAALGAGPGELVRLVLGQGLVLTLAAMAIGLGAAVLLTRFMAAMLFNVAPRDPLVFGLVAAVLSLVALAATLIPARRAMTVDPIAALRNDGQA